MGDIERIVRDRLDSTRSLLGLEVFFVISIDHKDGSNCALGVCIDRDGIDVCDNGIKHQVTREELIALAVEEDKLCIAYRYRRIT